MSRVILIWGRTEDRAERQLLTSCSATAEIETHVSPPRVRRALYEDLEQAKRPVITVNSRVNRVIGATEQAFLQS